MVTKSVAIAAVAFISGLAVMYLLNGRDRQIAVAEPRQTPVALTPTPVAPATPVAAAPTPVVEDASPPSVRPSGSPGPEFDVLLDKIAAKHARFEREIPDPEWAPAVEGMWWDFYSDKPEVVVSSIACKATICEIFLAGRGMDEKSLEEIALKFRTKPLDKGKGGKQIFHVGVVTDGSGAFPVAVVTALASP